ncbi:MAG TPA: hypothetical protein VNI52_13240 [Sphingobacteriaceae bacterium]|nr:hypothetical protein [Sphingobacteriaceae bacterium]
MKLYFIALLSLLGSCSAMSNKDPKADKICTQEFKMISVQFKDVNGATVPVADFQTINKRLNKPMVQTNEGLPGYYIVASDADLNTLSVKGDPIQVSARNPKTNQTVTASYVISGGIDACHIGKVSGPEIITVN